MDDREALLRSYAAGGITWHDLQWRGFSDYVEVLAGLGALRLRPPFAPMEGPNLAARTLGRDMLRQAIAARP